MDELTESELPKAYDHSGEQDIYALWERSGVFAPPSKQEGEHTFSILMPPTNANGSLHVGHAVGGTLQDLMVRYHRMLGDATVWLPGLDHAGFETQVVFEKVLEKQGTSRFELERADFYQRTMDFTRTNSATILNQFKRLGASADWDRLKFTLDDDVVAQVYQTFKRLYDDGLAYRAARPVHWCSKHQTALSDLEVVDEVQTDALYTLQYGPLQIATTRPETIFGDVAVAVHPDDVRYKHLIGTDIEVNFGIETRPLPVVGDPMVDPAFGTGAVKMTPLHDPNDFAVAERHNLPLTRLVVDERGKLTELAGPFAGLKAEEARAAVVALLDEQKLLVATKPIEHSVKRCYKCKRLIEPRVLTQWFIAVNKPGKSGKALAPDAAQAVADGRTAFVTEKFRKVFDHWMSTIRDWNVSRQIVWGIQLPVWYCNSPAASNSQLPTTNSQVANNSQTDCPPIITTGENPENCPNCGGTELIRDPDVFDTWFSSCQWPVIVPKTTAHSDDAERFYPTSVMETGHDILFFWVARMIMLGLYLTDDVPFETVYLHGLVRDKDRQKMSKSKGNVMDPLAVIDEYGADALRMALIFGTAAGNDMPMGEEKIRGMRNFSNKMWNIARFVLTNTPSVSSSTRFDVSEIEIKDPGQILKQVQDDKNFTAADKLILEQLAEATRDVTRHIDTYRFHEAAQTVYDFVWNKFAAVYVEASKAQLADDASKENTQVILLYVLTQSLILLHPFMPFVTEAIWQQLPDTVRPSKLLISASWPEQTSDVGRQTSGDVNPSV